MYQSVPVSLGYSLLFFLPFSALLSTLTRISYLSTWLVIDGSLRYTFYSKQACWLRKKGGPFFREQKGSLLPPVHQNLAKLYLQTHHQFEKCTKVFKNVREFKGRKVSPTISMFRFGFLRRFRRENNFTDPSFSDRVDRGILIWGWKYPFDPSTHLNPWVWSWISHISIQMASFKVWKRWTKRRSSNFKPFYIFIWCTALANQAVPPNERKLLVNLKAL
jgi:hypothetical protein